MSSPNYIAYVQRYSILKVCEYQKGKWWNSNESLSYHPLRLDGMDSYFLELGAKQIDITWIHFVWRNFIFTCSNFPCEGHLLMDFSICVRYMCDGTPFTKIPTKTCTYIFTFHIEETTTNELKKSRTVRRTQKTPWVLLLLNASFWSYKWMFSVLFFFSFIVQLYFARAGKKERGHSVHYYCCGL